MVIELPPEIAADPRYAQLVAACSEMLVTPAELAKRWRVTQAHLCNLRRYRKGPAHIKIGTGAVRYRLRDIQDHEHIHTNGQITRERVMQAVSTMPDFSEIERMFIATHLLSVLFAKNDGSIDL